MDWFLYDNGLRHERVKYSQKPQSFTKIAETYKRSSFPKQLLKTVRLLKINSFRPVYQALHKICENMGFHWPLSSSINAVYFPCTGKYGQWKPVFLHVLSCQKFYKDLLKDCLPEKVSGTVSGAYIQRVIQFLSRLYLLTVPNLC